MNDFINYLIQQNISKQSLKNYKSDINHFASWLVLKIRSFGSYIESLDQGFPFLSSGIAQQYKSFLLENNVPLKTINRRLSTLRHLASYLMHIQFFDINFMETVNNIKHQSRTKEIKLDSLVDNFKSHLQAQKISDSTVKNYISDVNQFINWLESNKNYAQTT